MVSFWPWRHSDASPASFEKALAALATKVATTQAKLDRTRSSSRRVRVLCTLYLVFGYLVYVIVLVLVVGWKKMGPWEWSGVAGGPVLIYATRAALNAYYNFRIESLAAKLKEHQAERAKTIQKLKDATKYDSTLELLQKYGGSDAKPGKDQGAADGGAVGSVPGGKLTKGDVGPSTPSRTRVPPPPTANIRHDNAQQSTTPGRSGAVVGASPLPPTSLTAAAADALDVSAEFAPNAFGANMAPVPLPIATPAHGSGASMTVLGETHWYDRILDLLLGDDETAAKNRIVLLCSTCRLVNGQAPPGTRSLAEVGRWRCMGCGALNGEEVAAEAVVEGTRSVGDGSIELRTTQHDASDSDGQDSEPVVKARKADDDNDDDEGMNATASGQEATSATGRVLRSRSKKAK